MDEITSSNEHWHFDKGIGLATIIAAAVFLLGGIAAWYATVSRVASLEIQYGSLNNRVVGLLEQQSATDMRQDSMLLLFRTEIREDSSQMNQKLDRITEIILNARN